VLTDKLALVMDRYAFVHGVTLELRMEKPFRAGVRGFVAALGSLALFAWLAGQVLRGQTIQFDDAIRNAMHSVASPTLTWVFRALSELGAPRFLLPLGLVMTCWLLSAGRRHAAVVFFIAVMGGEVFDQVLKYLFRRPRPEAFFGLSQPMGYSFPSGHSVVACCFYGVAAAILTVRMASRGARAATWTAAALLALGIGLSRIYLGVHYPSDVLAGYAAAIIWVAALRTLYLWWRRRPTRDSNT
jgi:membrane-associated phospholipid phosphatase